MPKKKQKRQKWCKAKKHRWGKWREGYMSRSRECNACDTTEVENFEVLF